MTTKRSRLERMEDHRLETSAEIERDVPARAIQRRIVDACRKDRVLSLLPFVWSAANCTVPAPTVLRKREPVTAKPGLSRSVGHDQTRWTWSASGWVGFGLNETWKTPWTQMVDLENIADKMSPCSHCFAAVARLPQGENDLCANRPGRTYWPPYRRNDYDTDRWCAGDHEEDLLFGIPPREVAGGNRGRERQDRR